MRSPLLRRAFLLAALLPLASCSGDGAGEDLVSQVASVSVTPADPALSSIGATTTLAATAKDATGKTLTGVTITWSTSDASVANVSTAGVVTANGNGTAMITATATSAQAEASGSVTVTVQQKAATVALQAPDDTLQAGQTMQLSATAADAGGTAIASPTYTWASSDTNVATVDANGIATAVGAGEAKLSATLDGVKGESGVTVLFVSVKLQGDTTLSGTLVADTFEVAQGVTITATEDFELVATGPVDVAGTITGDCVGLSIDGRAGVSITGTLRNSCTDTTAAGGDVTIRADGALSLAGVTLESSGEIVIANAPLEASGAADLGPALSSRFAAAARSTAAESPCEFRSVAISHKPTEAPVDKDGKGVLIRCLGTATFWGGNGLKAQHGGEGSDDHDEEDAEAEEGGEGGDVRIEAVEGDLIFWAETHDGITGTELAAGTGGDGGDAVAENDEPGGDADADSGSGGDGGSAAVQAVNGAVRIMEFGALRARAGSGGDGGDAWAVAADGKDAGTEPAQEGGHADADGGSGGDGGTMAIDAAGGYEGSSNIVQGTADGGWGGDADATAGDGGDGNAQFPDGAPGGSITANAGDGGDAGKDSGGVWLGEGGDGGDSELAGGKGGAGANLCPSGTGGNGGKGGDGWSDGTDGGEGITEGEEGDVDVADATGDGGPGGSGLNPGAGGQGGEDEADGIDPNAFRDGPNGGGCRVETSLGVSVTVASDPAGHNPYVGMYQVTQVTVTIEGNAITISGGSPWITVAGTLDGNSFSATGSGDAAGFSGVSTTFSGTVTRDSNGNPTGISGTLTVGVNGELYGTPITYNVSG